MKSSTLLKMTALLWLAVLPESAWPQIPGAVMSIDFTDAAKSPRKRLTDAGLAWQLPVNFIMRRESVVLKVKTPEAGEVNLATDSGEALIEVTTTREDATTFKIEIRSTLGRMSVEALQKQVLEQIRKELAEHFAQAADDAKPLGPAGQRRYLRMKGEQIPNDDAALTQAYIDRRAIELGKDALRSRLEKLVEKRPRWVPTSEQAKWHKAGEDKLHDEYLRLLGLDIAEEHLRKCGIEVDAATRNIDKQIVSRFKGLHAFATGAGTGGDPETLQALRSFTREQQARLTQALTIDGAVQFVPQAGAGDDNSQWFNGQRVASSIAFVPAVHVIGRLDAAGGDRSDWWTLLDYDEDKIRLRFDDELGLRYEIYASPRKETCLRVIATRDAAFAYSFELLKRSSGGEGQPVVIHESPGTSDATFPY